MRPGIFSTKGQRAASQRMRKGQLRGKQAIVDVIGGVHVTALLLLTVFVGEIACIALPTIVVGIPVNGQPARFAAIIDIQLMSGTVVTLVPAVRCPVVVKRTVLPHPASDSRQYTVFGHGPQTVAHTE